MDRDNKKNDASEAQAALRLHVGDQLFERGRDVFSAGRVGRLTTQDVRTTATVSGTDACEVVIRRTLRGFEGHGSCPVSDGFDFCHHCVAVALAIDLRDTKRERALGGAPEARLKVFLEDLPRERLIELIATAAGDLPDLNERLQLQADIATGAMDKRRARKLVTSAMPLRQVWQRPQVVKYFAKAVAGINGLVEVAPDMDPAILNNVAQYALDRHDAVLERIDDTDGHRWFLQDRLRALFALALAHSNATAEEKAVVLLERVLRDGSDLFDDELDDFAAALGEDGRRAFYALAQARLDASKKKRSEDADNALNRFQLLGLLRADAERRDDIEALIDLQKSELRGAVDRYQLAALYLRNSDLDAALSALTEADAQTDARNLNHELRVEIHSAREEWSQAAEAQLQVVLQRPSLAPYHKLEELAERAGRYAISIRNAKTSLRRMLNAGDARRGRAADLLAELAFTAGEPDEAFALIVEHVSDADRLLEMVHWFGEQEPVRASQLVDCAVEATIAQKKSGAYKQVVSMLKTHREVFDRLGPGAFASFVAALKVRHELKRNLIALLGAAGWH
ncbi:MAG: SWIM zinc finger domain-containing protein [Gammaproteobacteria bacterium]